MKTDTYVTARGLCVCAALMAFVAGCGEGAFAWLHRKEIPPEAAPKPAAVREALLADTVGEAAILGDATPLRLRGFGVVINLGDDGGSGDSPTTVREYLLEYLAKEYDLPTPGARRGFSAQKLLDSPGTAVVAIHGLVPPGAPRGTPFDVQVEALGSRTRSLEGGILLPCELKLYDVAASGQGLIAGQPLARAQGPVFTNPFGGESERSSSDPRRGAVLGGGRTLEERTVRIMLEQASYTAARQIERRINERFGHSPSPARADSAAAIVLRTPPEFAERPQRFLELAMHLLRENSPDYVERKLREMAGQMTPATNERLEHLSLIWEGVGRSVLPHIQPLYSHQEPPIAFYAARAGLRLSDATALPIVARFAHDEKSPYRISAIEELGECNLALAAPKLEPLLDSDDQAARVAAYEGLLRHRHPSIKSVRFPCAMDKRLPAMTLDLVRSDGRPMLYVKRSNQARIAVFGSLPVQPPVFLNHPRGWVMLNATDASDELTVMCRTRRSGKLSDALKVPMSVEKLIQSLAALPVTDDEGPVPGLGLHYALVVQVLDELCGSGSIPARLVLEHADLTDLLGPPPEIERPEGDEPKTADSRDSGAPQPKGAPLLPSGERPE